MSHSRLTLLLSLSFLCGGACGDSPARWRGQHAIDVQDGAEASVHGEALHERFVEDLPFLLSPLLRTSNLCSGTSRSRIAVLAAFRRDSNPTIRPDDVWFEARGAGSGPWQFLRWVHIEASYGVAVADLPVGATETQIRLHERDARHIRMLTWSLYPSTPCTTSVRAPPVDLRRTFRRTALTAVLDEAGVSPRSAWGAREPVCATAEESKTIMTVHHTAGDSGDPETMPALLRAIQSYHLDGRGWCDIGYHLLVTSDGGLWGGRDTATLGAHVGGHNHGNLGIAFVGCFDSWEACASVSSLTSPPPDMLDAGARLVAAAAREFGIAVGDNTVLGHRDFPDTATVCPGDNLATQLAWLRDDAQRLLGDDEEEPEDEADAALADADDDPLEDANADLLEGSSPWTSDENALSQEGGCAALPLAPAAALLSLGAILTRIRRAR